jgi:CHAD domain-containing protein
MPYRLSPDDKTLRHALRRLARSELGAALAHVSDGPMTPAGVHDIRKRIKKLRGALRLVRPGFAAFKPENAALRDAARALASARDAEVRLATLDGVFPTLPPPLQPFRDHLSHLRDAPRQDGRSARWSRPRRKARRSRRSAGPSMAQQHLVQRLEPVAQRFEAVVLADGKDHALQRLVIQPALPAASRVRRSAIAARSFRIGQRGRRGRGDRSLK